MKTNFDIICINRGRDCLAPDSDTGKRIFMQSKITIKLSECELITHNEYDEPRTENGIEVQFCIDNNVIYTDYLDSMSRYCQYDRCKTIAGFAEQYAEYVVKSIQKLDNVRIWSVVLQVSAAFENSLNEFLTISENGIVSTDFLV